MKAVVLLALLMLAAPLDASPDGGLQFESAVVTLRGKPTQTSFTAAFEFTNRGSSTVSVIDIDSSCDCANANADSSAYAPGQKGRISAKMAMSRTSEGKVTRIFTLRTEEPEPRSYTLRLELDMPAAVTFTPSLLTWRADETSRTKETLVTGQADSVIELMRVSDPRNGFRTEVRKEGKGWLLAVTPQIAQNNASSDLLLELAVDSVEIRRTFFVRVLPEPKSVDPLAPKIPAGSSR